MNPTQLANTVQYLFENSPIGMCAVEMDGTVLRRNPACQALLSDDSTSIFALVPEGRRRELERAMVAVYSGEQRAFRMAVDVESGRRIEINGIPMRGGTGDMMLHLVDITDRHVREQELRDQADHDELTGLANRRSFDRFLSARIAQNEGGVLLMLDLDGFKKVNDALGHKGGDAVLCAAAQALRDSIRPEDVIARVGGDEFALLLHVELRAAMAIGARIIQRIEIAARLAARGYAISASIGMVKIEIGAEPAALFEAADRAMYAAKRAGKGRCVSATL
jgi:diguanylate cyclase (GGDEF)-like protein